MANRYLDWLNQAKRDLSQAEQSHHSKIYEWSCFACHQAAEKAVKSLHLYLNQEVWGHVIAKLLDELPFHIQVPDDIIEKAHVLDAFYIAPRYPNGHPEGAPFENYGSLQSSEAIKHAGEIIEFISSKLA